MELVQEIQDRVILGLPIITSYGVLKPLTMEEFIKRQQSVAVICMNKRKLLSELGFSQQNETGQSDKEIHKMLMELNEIPMKQLMEDLFKDLYQHYVIITRYCVFYDEVFNETIHESEEEFDKQVLMKSIEFLQNLSEEQFDEFRTMLIALHGQSEISAKLNPYLERRELKAKQAGRHKKDNSPTFATMISSIAMYSGINYEDIARWNILQITHSFQRISYFISNSDSVLYGTVAPDVDIINWSENIVADKGTNKDKTLDEFKSSVGSKLN